MEEKKIFYQTNWFMWLMLIFIPPVGIILIWLCHKDFTQKKKIILSIVFVLWFFIALSMNRSSTKPTKQIEQTKKEVVSTEIQSEEPTVEESETTDPETMKNNAEIYDTKLMALIDGMDSHYTDFVNVIENGGTDLELYNAAKDVDDVALDSFGKITDLECDSKIEGFADYQEAAELYASYIRDIGDKVQQYVDDGKTSDLSDAQSSMNDKETIAYDLLAKRMTFLQNAGFTSEEISTILGVEETESTE